jgi:hypothetical protein
LELVVVILELLFLKEDNFGTFRNFYSYTRQTFSLTDESENFTVEVHVKLKILEMADEKSGLKSRLCTVNFLLPFLTPHVLVREQGVTKGVVVLNCVSDRSTSLSDEVLRELFHRHRNAVE